MVSVEFRMFASNGSDESMADQWPCCIASFQNGTYLTDLGDVVLVVFELDCGTGPQLHIADSLVKMNIKLQMHHIASAANELD